jgi:hypothetical protein
MAKPPGRRRLFVFYSELKQLVFFFELVLGFAGPPLSGVAVTLRSDNVSRKSHTESGERISGASTLQPA